MQTFLAPLARFALACLALAALSLCAPRVRAATAFPTASTETVTLDKSTGRVRNAQIDFTDASVTGLPVGSATVPTTTGQAWSSSVTVPAFGADWLLRRSPSLSKKIVIIGSSVAAGGGATSYANSWAGLFTTAMTGRGWTVINNSIPGNTIAAVNARLHRDALAFSPNFVILALSLGNENITEAADATAREAIYQAWVTGHAAAIAAIRQHGGIPVIAGVYPRDNYNPTIRAILLRFMRWVDEQGVLSFDFLSTLDAGDGTWRTGTYADGTHANNTGHRAMFSSINLDAFDVAPSRFSPPPARVAGFVRTGSTYPAGLFTPSTTPDSMTLAFWARSTAGELRSIAGWSSLGSRLRAPTAVVWKLTAVGASATVESAESTTNANDGIWHHFAITHNAITGVVTLFVDGVSSVSVTTSGGSAQVCDLFGVGSAATGGSANGADYSDFVVLRYPASAEMIQQIMAGQVSYRSAEAWCPMDDAITTGTSLAGDGYRNLVPALRTVRMGAGVVNVRPPTFPAAAVIPPLAVAVPATLTSFGRPGYYAFGGGLRYDYTGDGTTHSWITSASGSGGSWGSIGGTLADQTDLAAALAAKAPLASPALTGTPTAPTATVGTNTTQIATTALVKAAADAAQAAAVQRANHTGTQSADTITDGTTNKAYTALEKTKLAAITGTNTGDQTTITGNAGSATILQTARTIDGVSFNGSANITLPKRFTFSFDAGTATVLTAYTSPAIIAPQAGTITGWYLRGDVSGSVTVDVKKATGSGSFSSITASAKPALSSASYGSSTTLTGWTTSFAAGDCLVAQITGTPATLQQVTLVITYQ